MYRYGAHRCTVAVHTPTLQTRTVTEQSMYHCSTYLHLKTRTATVQVPTPTAARSKSTINVPWRCMHTLLTRTAMVQSMYRCGAYLHCRRAPQRYSPCTVAVHTYHANAHRNDAVLVPLRCALTRRMRTATAQSMYPCGAHLPCRRAPQQ